jgi:hypothetical protein
LWKILTSFIRFAVVGVRAAANTALAITNNQQTSCRRLVFN